MRKEQNTESCIKIDVFHSDVVMSLTKTCTYFPRKYKRWDCSSLMLLIFVFWHTLLHLCWKPPTDCRRGCVGNVDSKQRQLTFAAVEICPPQGSPYFYTFVFFCSARSLHVCGKCSTTEFHTRALRLILMKYRPQKWFNRGLVLLLL